jgi:putative tryptophan/tyrosine transport system substrate-binding protein
MSGIPDPVGSGVIASLARPGGNLTGVALTPGAMLHSKALQLFKEAVPTLSRVAVLWGGEAPRVFTDVLHQAAAALGLTWLPFTVWSSQEMPALLHDLQGAFTAITEAHADGLVVFGNPVTVQYEDLIVEFAAAHRLPTLFHAAASVRAGGLMSYYPDLTHVRHRTAVYVDKILRGAKPADLPVEQPMKFELAINLKTAQALGLTIPPTLLFQADEVIR